jgi:hypothetical protein
VRGAGWQRSAANPWRWDRPRHLIAEQKCVISVIHIWLVVRTTPVHVVAIERRRSEIGQSVRIVLHLQAARGIEGNVMVDELGEVGIERRDATSRTGPVESIA